jgi:uncharacterized membrane protein
MNRTYKISIASLVLLITHAVGFWGLQLSDLNEYFIFLTPIQLVFTAFLIFAFHQNWDFKFIGIMLLIGILGYLSELLGVKTGLIFGEYHYGETLGFKLFDIPVLIGLNWIILIYCTGNIVIKLDTNSYVKAALGAFLMIAIDYYIEPVAISFDFWTWDTTNGIIPIQNYIAWYILSFLFLLLFLKIGLKKVNPMALIGYIIQLLFFMSFYWYKL